MCAVIVSYVGKYVYDTYVRHNTLKGKSGGWRDDSAALAEDSGSVPVIHTGQLITTFNSRSQH